MVSLRTTLAAGAGALALALPAAAQAGTLTRTAAAITYTADQATGVAESVQFGNDSGKAFVYSERGFSSSDCPESPDSDKVVLCDSVAAFVINLLGFDDVFYAQNLTDATTIEAHGGGGNDQLDGGHKDDRLFGEDGNDSMDGKAGNDTIEGSIGDDKLAGDVGDDTLRGGDGDDGLYGGEGNDTLDAGPGSEYGIEDGPGDDKIEGGPGSDNLIAGTGRDTFNGGDGTDGVVYDARTAGVTITLDSQADDGEAGEGDNIGADVENATGGSGSDRIVGQQAAGTSGGYLYGLGGDDNIKGGPGADRIEGGDGNDTIDSRDGRDDSIDCGGGTDTVFGDPADSTTNCEFAPDADGDGFLPPADCYPNDPLLHPGAGEVLGNAIDEDCVGGPGYAVLQANVSTRLAPFTRFVRIDRLRVVELAGGELVELKCSGKGCPKRRTVRRTATRPGVVRLESALPKRLRPGIVVQIRITKPNTIGRSWRVQVRRGRDPKITRGCLAANALTPAPCA